MMILFLFLLVIPLPQFLHSSIKSIELENQHSLASSDQNILCMEIGGKKILAALMPIDTTLKKLRTVDIVSFPSKPWFTQLPQLFNHATESPLCFLLQKPHLKVSVSIFGPLFENHGLIDVAQRNIPCQIHKLCKEQSKKPLQMKTDTICWSRGCIEFQKLKSIPVKFPFLAVILKTGVGLALVEENKITAIESYIDCTFSRLEHTCKNQGQKFNQFNIHQALGNGFFDWALKKGEFLDEEMQPFLALYQARFQTFLEEVCKYIEKEFSVSIHSVFVGGENSRFIEEQIPNVTVLNSITLKNEEIAPEIIQLLGCLKIAQKEDMIMETYPSYEEIQRASLK
jgi:hypothetical protein